MNLLRLSIILALIFTLGACDNNTVSCVQSDWVGTYTGTQDCDGLSEDVTMTITASGTDAIVVMYETEGVEVEFAPMTPDECTLSKTESDDDMSLTVEATINGNNLTFTDVITIGTESATCTITAIKN